MKLSKLSRRGQSMWVLTKMAMVFFIGALAIILLIFGGFTKTGLCASSASASSSKLATAINQIINSPLEDERRVITLEPALAIGESKTSRYNITVAKRILPDSPFNALMISSQSELDGACRGGLQVSYPRSLDAPQEKLFLISSRTQTLQAPFSKMITIKPSLTSSEESQGNLRSQFVVVMKCTSKTLAREKYLFIQDCVQDDAESCLGFTSDDAFGGSRITDVCSFGS